MDNNDTATTGGKVRVMQAASAGKSLQRFYRDGSRGWEDIYFSDHWDWLNFDYRISPKPREFCLTGNIATIWTPECVGKGLRVREVIA